MELHCNGCMSKPVNLLLVARLLRLDRRNDGEIVSVCQASMEQRAYRAQWGRPHQGGPQTAGSLTWCIGLGFGILIGPSASDRGPWCSWMRVPRCLFYMSVFVFLLFFMVQPAPCLYLLSASICLCCAHLHSGVAFQMCENACVCVCVALALPVFFNVNHIKCFGLWCTSSDLSFAAESEVSARAHTQCFFLLCVWI